MKSFRIFTLLAAVGVTAVCMMGASGGCGSDLHKAALAADTIANSLNSAAQINHTVYAQGQESEAERIAVATVIDQATQANDAFIAQLQLAQANGSTVTADTVIAAFQTLSTQLDNLNQNGVLHLKNPQAQAAFSAIMQTLTGELSILQSILKANTTSSRGSPAAPLTGFAVALTAEEIDLLIGLAITAFGEGAELVQKLIGMKGETDAELLTDASEQDAEARKQAQADEQAEASSSSGS